MARMRVSREKRAKAFDATHSPPREAGSTASAHNQGVGDCRGPAMMKATTRSEMLNIVQMPSVARNCSLVSGRRER